VTTTEAPPKRARARHTRSAAARTHVPARVHAGRAHGLPSPRRVLAAQVVSWHNRHPLARRIGRRELGGYGVVSLPFSPPVAQGEGPPMRFPMFDDLTVLPGLSRQKVIALALAQGWDDRPGAAEWPLRKVPVAKGWDPAQSQPIHLLTVALKRGRRRPPLRLLVGRGAASAEVSGVVGHRLLSRPRMALGALALAVPVLFLGWMFTWPVAHRATQAPIVAIAPQNEARPMTTPVAPPVGSVMPRATRPAPAPMPFEPSPSEPPLFTPADLPRTGTAAGGRGPRVGTGVPIEGQETRAAGPSSFRLVGSPQRDPTVLRSQATQLQSILSTMGQSGSRLRMDVIGTPEGDALSVGPLPDQAEAERIARRLAARGITLKLIEQ
jgi:hypothetical protein